MPTVNPTPKEFIQYPALSFAPSYSPGPSGYPILSNSSAIFENFDGEFAIGQADAEGSKSIPSGIATVMILAIIILISASVLLAIKRSKNNGDREVRHNDNKDMEARIVENMENQDDDSSVKISSDIKGFDAEELKQPDGCLSSIREIVSESSSRSTTDRLGTDLPDGMYDLGRRSSVQQDVDTQKSWSVSVETSVDSALSHSFSKCSSRSNDMWGHHVSASVDEGSHATASDRQKQIRSKFNALIAKQDWEGVIAAAEKIQSTTKGECVKSSADSDAGSISTSVESVGKCIWKGVVLGAALQIHESPRRRRVQSGRRAHVVTP